MIVKLIRFLAGLALLPFCLALIRTLVFLMHSIKIETSVPFLHAPLTAFGAGLGLWLLIHFTLPQPARAYILAHELTHALWGMLMGAKVSNLQVRKNTGSVRLSKSNFMVTLAPYFFPLHAVGIIAAYQVARLFVAVDRYQPLWLALVGLAWGFHLTGTIGALLQRQSDIREYGRLFSYTLILALNVAAIIVWIVAVTSASLTETAGFLREDSLAAGAEAWRGLSAGARRIAKAAAGQ